MLCTCFSDDKKVLSVSNLKNMVNALEHYDNQQRELFDREKGVKYGIDYYGINLTGYQGQ